MDIILASASPRRRELIKKLNYLSVTVRPSSAEERADGIEAEKIAVILALSKAKNIAGFYPDTLVLGADTIVSLNGKIYGKPSSSEEAVAFLKELAGKTHEVITGIALIKGDKTITAREITKVTFAEFNEEAVRSYVATGKPLDKAGAYGAQDKEFSFMVKNIDGDVDNVIGLPVKLLDELIRKYYA